MRVDCLGLRLRDFWWFLLGLFLVIVFDYALLFIVYDSFVCFIIITLCCYVVLDLGGLLVAVWAFLLVGLFGWL